MNATQQMAAFRPQMLSYATRQLGDDELAEDVVQDAFVAAFDRAAAFRGGVGERVLGAFDVPIGRHHLLDGGGRRGDSATPGGTAGANQPGSAKSGAAQAGQSGQAGASGAAGGVNAQGSADGSADGSAGGVYPGGISGGGTGDGSLGQSGVSAASGGASSQQGGLARTGFGAVSVAVGGALVLGAGTVMVLRSRRRAS